MDAEPRTSDEKLWAALAHGAILVNLTTLVGIGTIGAIAIWLLMKKKSTYIGYQALQAFIFQSVVVFVAIITGFPGSGIGWLLMLAGSAYGSYAAYRCYSGYDFRYPWLGNMITSFRPKE